MMVFHFFIVLAAFVGVFIAFLVLSRTLGSVINQLAKLEYVVRKDVEFVKETYALLKAMKEEKERRRSMDGEFDEDADRKESDSSGKEASTSAAAATLRSLMGDRKGKA